ncbi:translation initiation factor eIF 4e-like domain-containing protein [Mycotypha africana]|uniref:translation initiation factor eIF 4e-like domain-containing protein n=1 Tax=Mycotypha africana TaxID=64632 RepID=UPI00230040E7|nr:translation initiation factor eIF 4e-like domain-containing protein [Mycotypha africana]KAI8968431.1 translation initiation factor eIF 4e-like domain-containing protein [Mycotypha africana]
MAAAAVTPEVLKLTETIDYTNKHPLQNKWTLWFDNPGKKTNAQSWADNLKEIITVDTVEDFWSTFNNVAKVNHLTPNANYHFFKEGVRPEWEDPANAEGGKFTIQFPKTKAGEAINEYWMSILMSVVGEQLATEEEICGVVVSIRKSFYRLALWIKTSKDEEKIEALRSEVRQALSLHEEIPIEFSVHADATAKVTASLAATSLDENEKAASEGENTDKAEEAPAKSEA